MLARTRAVAVRGDEQQQRRGGLLHLMDAARRDPGRRARLAVTLLFLVATAGLAWGLAWRTLPDRAGYDTLWYYKAALGYAGLPESDQIRETWSAWTRYAHPDLVAEWQARGTTERTWYLTCPDRLPTGDRGCQSPRWLGIYEQRPVFPLVVAALHPLFGIAALPVASFSAVLIFTLALGLGLARLAGGVATAILLALSFLNPLFATWLVQLTSDGWGIALWTVALVCSAHLCVSGRSIREQRSLLGLLLLVALLLAFTRPLFFALPVMLAVAAALAFAARAPERRSLGAGALVALLPLPVFWAYLVLAHLPTFADQLQDLPTRHFQFPDIQDPIAWLRVRNIRQALSLSRSWLADPLLVFAPLVAVAGFAVRRAWWTLPFLVGAAACALIQVLHPEPTQAGRTLAPAWITIHLGIALLMAGLLRFAARSSPGRRMLSLSLPGPSRSRLSP